MSQDIVSDALNQMMNALRAGKESVELKRSSKLLISILTIAKLKGYVKSYSQNKTLTVNFEKLNFCSSIKPRHHVQEDEIQKFTKRYLPAKDLGILLVSTSQGVMTHQTAMEKKIGGCLLAYFY